MITKIPLTYREYEILKIFLENQGKVFTRDNILNSIWSYDYYGDDKIVNTHIKNIRKKLGYDYIETVRGWDIELLKKIKSSLAIKIFLMMTCVFILLGIVMYGIVIKVMPNNYRSVTLSNYTEEIKKFSI